jgi:hypothetical protein
VYTPCLSHCHLNSILDLATIIALSTHGHWTMLTISRSRYYLATLGHARPKGILNVPIRSPFNADLSACLIKQTPPCEGLASI